MAPPERTARSLVASVLPPPPTISTSHACIDCEPQIITAKTNVNNSSSDSSTNSSNTNSSSEDSSDNKSIDNNSDKDNDITHSTVTLNQGTVFIFIYLFILYLVSLIYLDDNMHSPNSLPSLHGHVHDIKAIGSSHHSQPVMPSGASRAFGGVFQGNALGNAPNIGDFETIELHQPVEVKVHSFTILQNIIL